GLGASNLAVSGSTFFRVFDIAADSTVTISGLTIRDGHAAGGGGVLNTGQLTLRACTLTANAADGLGGGVWNLFGGTATVTSCLVSYNTATVLGGGLDCDGTTLVRGSIITHNTAGQSGGLDCDGPLTI